VEEAEDMFDSISYEKGAAWIKQAQKVIGLDTLKAALHQYFAKFAWKNTELKDFIGVLSEEYDKSQNKLMGPDFKFDSWAESWLTTTGVTTIEPFPT
jgi:aminopeptidase N